MQYSLRLFIYIHIRNLGKRKYTKAISNLSLSLLLTLSLNRAKKKIKKFLLLQTQYKHTTANSPFSIYFFFNPCSLKPPNHSKNIKIKK